MLSQHLSIFLSCVQVHVGLLEGICPSILYDHVVYTIMMSIHTKKWFISGLYNLHT